MDISAPRLAKMSMVKAVDGTRKPAGGIAGAGSEWTAVAFSDSELTAAARADSFCDFFRRGLGCRPHEGSMLFSLRAVCYVAGDDGIGNRPEATAADDAWPAPQLGVEIFEAAYEGMLVEPHFPAPRHPPAARAPLRRDEGAADMAVGQKAALYYNVVGFDVEAPCFGEDCSRREKGFVGLGQKAPQRSEM